MTENEREILLFETLKMAVGNQKQIEASMNMLLAAQESLIELSPSFAERYQERLVALRGPQAPDVSSQQLLSKIESHLQFLKQSSENQP